MLIRKLARAADIVYLNGQVLECSWVRRGAGGLINAVAVPAAAEGDFRSLMSELGAVMAPRLVVPADNLGFGGFQVSGELALTRTPPTAWPARTPPWAVPSSG